MNIISVLLRGHTDHSILVFFNAIKEKKMLKSIMFSLLSVGDGSARAFLMHQLTTDGSTIVKHFLASKHHHKDRQDYSSIITTYIAKVLQQKSELFWIFQLKDHIGFLTLYRYIGTQYYILSEGVVEGYPEMLEPSEVG